MATVLDSSAEATLLTATPPPTSSTAASAEPATTFERVEPRADERILLRFMRSSLVLPGGGWVRTRLSPPWL